MPRKYSLIIGCVCLIMGLSGCALFKKPAHMADSLIDLKPLRAYSGPKITVAVADFDIKAGKATIEAAAGLREMLIAGLNETNRFMVVPGHKEEGDKNEDLIIAVKIVDFEPRASGGHEGVGGGGSSASGTLGSLLGVSVNKSSIALNIRIVDAATSKTLFSERVSGQAVDAGGQHKGENLNEELSAYADTAMGGAISKCMIDAVRYIVDKVPEKYYKEATNGKA